MRSLVGAALLVAALPLTPACAQTVAAEPTSAPDPARLAAAQALIEKIVPADRRDAMIDQIVRPMVTNLRLTMPSTPDFDKIKADNPKLAAIMDEFMNDEFERSLVTTKAALPALFDAMARAYARRFTLDDLKALDVFFGTPAGRAYAERGPTIMSDSDVLAAQRAMMSKAMAGREERIAALTARVEAEVQRSK